MNKDALSLDPRCYALLGAEGLDLSPSQQTQLQDFMELVQEWNPVAGLVSRGDALGGLPAHVADSLALAGVLQECEGTDHVDIGSGGGFPAIPLAVVLPERRFLLLERSMRKCGFLTKVVAHLGLRNVEIAQLDFPRVAHEDVPITLSARAVERPRQLLPAIAAWMRPGDHFLCQMADTSDFASPMFHVEQIVDAWTDTGLRRAALHVVHRIA